MPRVWIDRQLIDKNDARISIFDHAFLHGDGVSEGMRLYEGRVFLLDQHLAQLYANSAAIGLTIPMHAGELREVIHETIQANQRQAGYVRVIITRGPGTLALDPRKCVPSVLVLVDEIGLYPRELVESGLQVVSLICREALPRSGSLSRGSLVPLRSAALQAGYCEAILFDQDGQLLGSIESVPFCRLPEGWWTSPAGITSADPVYRQYFLDTLSEAGQSVQELPLPRARLPEVQEGFLTCAAVGIAPIVQIDGAELPVPIGSQTLALRQLLQDRIGRG